jgi:dTDP-4-amino-4,6-dideoxygalactose transaminase
MITLHSTTVDPSLRASLLDAVASVIDSNQYILGPHVERFEQELARLVGFPCVSCASGTDAIVILLQASGIPKLSRVFTPAYGFIATPEAILRAGATPVFVDVAPRTACMDPVALAEALYKFRATPDDAVLTVDMFGRPSPYHELLAASLPFGCKLFCDRAQSMGAYSFPPSTVSFTTSFFPTKPLPGYGDGGALFSALPSVLSLARSIRSHGRQPGSKHIAFMHGLNSRLDEIQAAMLLHSIPLLQSRVASRRSVALLYDTRLSCHDSFSLLDWNPNSAHAIFPLVCKDRSAVSSTLATHNIESSPYYQLPFPHMPIFSDCPSGPIPNSIHLCNSILAIPMHHNLSYADVDKVIAALSELP